MNVLLMIQVNAGHNFLIQYDTSSGSSSVLEVSAKSVANFGNIVKFFFRGKSVKRVWSCY